MPGPELSVEGIVFDGKAHFYGVTESHHSGPPYFVGTGHDFFSAHERADEIYAYTQQVITAVGMWQSPFHIELKAPPDGALDVIEVHSRFGGGMIMELVRHGVGARAFADYVQVLAGQPIVSTPRLPLCCEQFLCVSSGKVAKIELRADLARHPALITHALDLRPGDAVESDVVPIEYAGYVSFRAVDRDDARRFRRVIDDSFSYDVR
jgi:ATP-grasp domain